MFILTYSSVQMPLERPKTDTVYEGEEENKAF